MATIMVIIQSMNTTMVNIPDRANILDRIVTSLGMIR